MAILITGGLGYVGSYVGYKCAEAGYECVILDDLSTSHIERHHEIESVTNRQVPLFIGDVGDLEKLREVFSSHTIDIVIHCAGKKSVPESITNPLKYYLSNISNGIQLLTVMKQFNVHSMIFSSSAAIYSQDNIQPVSEESITTGAANPYSETKLIFENICKSLATRDDNWRIGILRYFNPVGANELGMLGDVDWQKSTSLFNNVIKTVKGVNKHLEVYGIDYKTRDGSCVRDFVHIDDLAAAHVNLLKTIKEISGVEIWNLGTGAGTTVLEFITACERAIERPIATMFKGKRKGDIDVSYCDISKARRDLNYHPRYNLDDMIRHGMKFHGVI